MKAISTFLLLLIVIGLGAFATQRVWVPKLVNRILASENSNPALVEASQPNIILKDGRQCYAYSHEATVDAPYTVNEFLDIKVDGGFVAGKKTGNQSGPDMTNGYEGLIMGTLNKNTITSVYSYTVEGSQNKEQEIYKAGKTGLEKHRYPLKEEVGILVPDMTKEFTKMIYARVECAGSN